MKRILSMLLAVITLVSLTVLPASAEVGTHNDVEVIIHDENLPEETKAKIVEFYTSPEAEDEETSTYGLTCTLLGHDYEYSTVTNGLFGKFLSLTKKIKLSSFANFWS